jgi:hypothetical protein
MSAEETQEEPQGRTAHFQSSAEAVRTPQFQSMQQVVGKYRRSSLLDNLMPTKNGLGDQDFARSKMGINKSTLGQSDSTFDKGLWLRMERPPDLYKNG